MTTPSTPPGVSMNPDLIVADPVCARWLAQVTLRLRREVAWAWQQRGSGAAPSQGALPPTDDPSHDSLDFARFRDDKRAFFENDITARYLTERIVAADEPTPPDGRRGDWAWIARECALTSAAQFVLACALAGRADAAIGPVCAACQNDLSRPWPTLALAQRLWDDPLAIAACADASHVLFRRGLLHLPAGRDSLDWQQQLETPALVAQALLDPDSLPGAIETIDAPSRTLPADMLPLLARLRSDPPTAMQVLPLHATRGTDFADWARALAHANERRLMIVGNEMSPERPGLAALATVCWLRGADLLLPEQWQERCGPGPSEHWYAAVAAVPVRWYLPVTDGSAVAHALPSDLLLPAAALPSMDVDARTQQLVIDLADAPTRVRAALPEAARRFRFAERPLARVTAAAAAMGDTAGQDELFSVFRAEAQLELGGLATEVTPRFELNELVLPAAQTQQLREIVSAMKVLGRVHYTWGTARAWNESGLSVLFFGPPGTGKTMAAEALANELKLPMYRIDLSQVVNKYIGETEKNLRRIFDAAERSDVLMFFDEADALFGKRTEVKDAHDRFANIEISYLLERMERFKGLAVLATNRRKDLDEAFTRRLRYIVEFPVPGAVERERLWRQAFPERVDVSQLDTRWLAQQFELAGGHIRSAAFNACLLAAGQSEDAPARVDMVHALTAVKRELEKLNRVAGREQFGRYAGVLGSVA
jgi:adenylate kinase family enzyme